MSADIEFVAGGEPPEPPQPAPPRRSRRWIGLVVGAALVVTAIVVVTTNGSPHRPTASNSTFAPPPRIGPIPPQPQHFTRPGDAAFGPAVSDVAAAGGRLYALSRTRLGSAGRWGGRAIARPASFRRQPTDARPVLATDPAHDLVWAVAVGGTLVRGFDARTLQPLVTTHVHHTIAGAVAMDGSLWLATDAGLFTDQAGPHALRHVRGSPAPLAAVIADPLDHAVLSVDENDPVRVRAFTGFGAFGPPLRLPLQAVSSSASARSGLWLSGITRHGPRLVVLSPSAIRIQRVEPLPAELGELAGLVGSYANRVLVRGAPDGGSVYCADGASGTFHEVWRLPPGPVSLGPNGLFVVTGKGVSRRDARACLSG